MSEKLYSNEATRHAKALYDDVKRKGKLDEAWLPLKTLHFKLYKLIPMTIKMFLKRKIPILFLKRIEKYDSLKDLYDKFE